MVLVVSDACSAFLNWLKTHADAADIRAAIYDGATNILESGDFDPAMAQEYYLAREQADEGTKVLAVAVHDAGEDVLPGPRMYMQNVVLRIFDWRKGNRNIRTVRQLVQHLLDDDELDLVDVGTRGQGLLTLRYVGRTGYRLFPEYMVEFEAMTFTAIVSQEED